MGHGILLDVIVEDTVLKSTVQALIALSGLTFVAFLPP